MIIYFGNRYFFSFHLHDISLQVCHYQKRSALDYVLIKTDSILNECVVMTNVSNALNLELD